ncbi:uncharacterized protein SRS1_16575 [Sporisorium reilianum f. sp. reilianum]|uniref:Uncharacterized protein n=1 Tax=Sporisorium reilianum f. sp. reilianum TaxID=72559 RepID=A0A2N8UD75_9BASI|nr:uncharacterized protein SRS1_16575 [Sporisorium reilianum f. sp. reilianum]
MWSALASLANPSIRTRRLATSTFFIATFAASILTVSLSASTILPCPANSRAKTRGTLADGHVAATDEQQDDEGTRQAWQGRGAIGQKVVLTRKGGWIEIDKPLKQAA